MLKKLALAPLMVPLLILVFAASSFAQTTASIQGTVSDQSGAAVVGAKVTVKNTALGIERTTQTNSTGAYEVPALPPGTYSVQVEMTGFETQLAKNLVLQVSQNSVQNFGLKVASTSEVVTVEATAPVVEATTMTVGQTIDQRTVQAPYIGLSLNLGLFDHPYVDAGAANAAVTAGRDASLKAAQESITLLRNQNNTLPLQSGAKIVVTGPSADSMTNQLGGWSVSWQGVFGAGHVCCMGPANQIPPGTTVQKGVLNGDSNAVYVADGNTAANTPADAYVVAVGEKAYAEGLGDNPAPQLPPDQKALIKTLEGTGKPVIVVVIAGRPVGLGPDAENANAILMAYQGSTEAGTAVSDVIFGKVNPSAKLPISWPSDAAAPGGDFNGGAPSPLGDQPKFFDQLPGTGGGQGHSYNPLYPFGYGLSYTTFTTSNLSVTPNVSTHGTATATFTVANTGARSGTNIVPVYVAQPVSSVVVPPQRLVGFTRVTLDAGQSKTVTVRFPVSTLGESQGDINASGPPTVEPGSYVVQLDKNTTTPYDIAVSAPFTIH